jgi:small-conductance mechanosensitive channel
MEIIFIVSVAILLFWGTIRNVRVATDIASSGLKAQAIVFVAQSAKEIKPEDMAVIEALKKI